MLFYCCEETSQFDRQGKYWVCYNITGKGGRGLPKTSDKK